MYPAINDTHILNLPIPKIDMAIEDQIVGNMRDAKAEKVQATQLREATKLAVDIAVEESEANAIRFLERLEG